MPEQSGMPDGPFKPTPADMAVDLLKRQERIEYALGKARKAVPPDAARIAALEEDRAVVRRAYYAEFYLAAHDVAAATELAEELGGGE